MENLKQNIKLEFCENGIFTALGDEINAPYDSKAKLYESLVSSNIYNRVFWGASPADYKKFAIDAIGGGSGFLLDVGCGGLVQTSDIYLQSKRSSVLLDSSLEMLKVAKKRLRNTSDAIPENLTLLQADGLNLPFNDSTFKTVCSFGMIHLFDDKKKFLAELLRVLKTDGTLFLSALTTKRTISRLYMSQLQKAKEVGVPWGENDYLSLFQELGINSETYMVGAILFSKIKLTR